MAGIFDLSIEFESFDPYIYSYLSLRITLCLKPQTQYLEAYLGPTKKLLFRPFRHATLFEMNMTNLNVSGCYFN
jgi:hypothetical protein